MMHDEEDAKKALVPYKWWRPWCQMAPIHHSAEFSSAAKCISDFYQAFSLSLSRLLLESSKVA